jgi:hypothetical protein
VVLDLSDEEMGRLSLIESGYDVREVSVYAADGHTYMAKAFVANWSVRLFAEQSPTHDYIGKIRRGAMDYGLSAEYQVGIRCVHQKNFVMQLYDTGGHLL